MSHEPQYPTLKHGLITCAHVSLNGSMFLRKEARCYVRQHVSKKEQESRSHTFLILVPMLSSGVSTDAWTPCSWCLWCSCSAPAKGRARWSQHSEARRARCLTHTLLPGQACTGAPINYDSKLRRLSKRTGCLGRTQANAASGAQGSGLSTCTHMSGSIQDMHSHQLLQ